MQRDNHDDLVAALRELDATPEEVKAWVPVAQQLNAWRDPRITPADHGRLLAVLGPALLQAKRATPVTPVRQAIRQRLARQNRLVNMLMLVHSQVSMLRLSFWVLSAVLVLLGIVVELAPSQHSVSIAWLRALAPLLAYLSVAGIFRSARLHTLEWEFACPPSPLQLIAARLLIVLGYDVGLGVILSVIGWAHGEGSFLVVTLHWLMPLLLITGLALALSLRLPAPTAAGIAYSGWLTLLIVGGGPVQGLLSLQTELLLGLAGGSLLGLALWRFTQEIPWHLLQSAP